MIIPSLADQPPGTHRSPPLIHALIPNFFLCIRFLSFDWESKDFVEILWTLAFRSEVVIDRSMGAVLVVWLVFGHDEGGVGWHEMMSSPSKALSTEVGNLSHQNRFPVDPNLCNCSESHLEHEDVEEKSPSLEASSSLSSEIEVFDADIADSMGNTFVALATNFSSIPPGQVQDYALGDSEHGEEIVMQTAISSGETGEKESEKSCPTRFKKRKAVLISQPENRTIHRKENDSGSGIDIVNDVIVGDITYSREPIMDIDDEDAICKRTRARYSLARFTLDELETFLQETDDDDDLQNVDDEEEYRKFLTAVLQGGDGDNQVRQGNEIVDDEDEENDADFEIEIEEALESDLDENTRGDNQEEREAAGRRPETRQNRRRKASAIALLPNAPISTFPVLAPETAQRCSSFSGHDGFINGFTAHQLGQLHCLIHEHVQLLIQVFSLCVLEASRHHIASQVQELISEMLHKRDQVMSWRRVPYPCFCFCPPFIHPSVRQGISKSLTAPCTSGSACSFDEQRDCSSGTNRGPLPDVISPSKEIPRNGFNGQESHFQTSDRALWAPFVNVPILSVLDVAPLNLVGKYMDDVSIAVQGYQRLHIQADCDTRFKKEPLFPFHSSESLAEDNAEVLRGTTLPTAKTLAAALVERTKKQSIALVPKEIVELSQRFFPLFNPDLFPHKPPPAPVANRVLFTDAEDELLALGLMEYNTDWKAIQQRFLPCKTKHQIFVRQKNRSSSKAPENPIKAVRRMKSSPLTAEEIARIQEGLKVFKLDWMSVWKFVVPYRDPSLLPRQWRIATGTQKSYKTTADKKEKRRLYESNRRKCKPAASPSWQTSSEKEEVPNATRETIERDSDFDDQQCGARAQGKEKPSPLGLSLSSCAPPGCPPHNKMKAKTTESTGTEGSAGKNHHPPSRSNRSCKKPLSRTKHIAAQKQAMDTPQQQVKRMESGSFGAVTPLKGSKTSASKSNLGLIMGRARKRDSNVNNTGATVENSGCA
ncbi:Myb-like protein O [Camellia lanceoleosa]|uniref:Myb-like protein O n=1 Tax=Camellia lanceoleosa TaxID=1840588 RepID=A0ACC0FZX5_9ERIC|nr:Myb-like protein O [Camellia lanceoleosa]